MKNVVGEEAADGRSHRGDVSGRYDQSDVLRFHEPGGKATLRDDDRHRSGDRVE